MCFSKRQLEDNEDMFIKAKNILLKIGAIECCDAHGTNYYWNMFKFNSSEMYARATAEFKRQGGTQYGLFQKAVKEVMDGVMLDGQCPLCENDS